MAPNPSIISSSATPTQKNVLSKEPWASSSSYIDGRDERDGLAPPRVAPDGRSLSNAGLSATSRSGSFTTAGSFSSDMRSTLSRSGTPRPDLQPASYVDHYHLDRPSVLDDGLANLQEKLNREVKIKEGSENLLEALNVKKAKQTKEQRSKVEVELDSSKRKIEQLKFKIAEIQRSKDVPNIPPRSQMSGLFRNNNIRPPLIKATIDLVNEVEAQETESPTFVLAELLQALERDGMQPEYYVERANSLVELFKRHPKLKYDLAWSVFGLRVQTMLVSDSKEVIAAGYRMTRYAITDLKSLQTIRDLETDYLVIVSMVKEGKANVEREQALKFVRAFLDVKDGIREISKAVVRTLVAVAEQEDDRLRGLCIETLAEILVKDPPLVVSAGGVGPLEDVIADGNFGTSESLVSAFLYLYDTPSKRKYLNAGNNLDSLFVAFTDSLSTISPEHRLKHSAKVISSLLQSWTGLTLVCLNGNRALKSLVASLQFTASHVRHVLLDLFFGLLRIKSPSWSSTFLAGRRLTTYARVANLRTEQTNHVTAEDGGSHGTLVNHFTALLLAVLLDAGLIEALLSVLDEAIDQSLKRKITLLISEILRISNRLLPSQQSAALQLLPSLVSSASMFGDESRFISSSTVYQIDSVNKTLVRSGSGLIAPLSASINGSEQDTLKSPEVGASQTIASMDESQFRSLLLESQILNHVNYTKWRWDVIQSIVEGPLANPKRFEEAKATRFLKLLIGFYRPFKFHFSNIRNTKPNQRYVKVGCSLFSVLLKNPEGVKLLAENKLLRQLAECLAQVEPMSGLTAQTPVFSPPLLIDTLSGGYFEMLGVLSSDPNGVAMLEHSRMFNMCYHIVEVPNRPDLIRILLANVDYSIDGHFRIIISKCLTACPKEIRIFATNLLRRYANSNVSASPAGDKAIDTAKWAIKLLVNQLYDPDVQVCENAIRILEEACNKRHFLEYIVKCRPALDHLGEIGAPLLLRFLSTSVGYHYLNDLDYITQEMDDWFLGRNDAYVAVVETWLSRAMEFDPKAKHFETLEEAPFSSEIPAHFYRELTRTAEGCQLLRRKGHFTEFVQTVKDYGKESEDSEIILKVKGCLWAVGNVGSMTLGGPFLEGSDIVRAIVNIAENSEVMTLRGTAFFVLGLISKSLHGMEMLCELGWDSAITANGDSLGFCIPLKISRLFSLNPWKQSRGRADHELSSEYRQKSLSSDDPINKKVLSLVIDLGNTVLTKKSITDLVHIKAKKPVGFQDPRFFREIMNILECHHFHLQVRRFVIDLFDKAVMRKLVLDDDDSEGDTEIGGDSRKGSTATTHVHGATHYASIWNREFLPETIPRLSNAPSKRSYLLSIDIQDDYLDPLPHLGLLGDRFVPVLVIKASEQVKWQQGKEEIFKAVHVSLDPHNEIVCDDQTVPRNLVLPSPGTHDNFTSLLELCANTLSGGWAGVNAGGYCHRYIATHSATPGQAGEEVDDEVLADVYFADELSPRLEWTSSVFGQFRTLNRVRMYCWEHCRCLVTQKVVESSWLQLGHWYQVRIVGWSPTGGYFAERIVKVRREGVALVLLGIKNVVVLCLRHLLRLC
ncbi:MAG: hypothetical protein M1814_005972 [Vezdaea aestivalis]|nr:MAG: hypothetical protein M1814_005972 [Vezdaea aestivalis]